jgi:hydrogenase maturation protein HypF
MLNLCHINTYEGEAAMLLENYVVDYNLEHCRSYCDLSEDGTIPTKQLLKNLSLDLKKGHAKTEIIANFIYTLATLVFQVAAAQRITYIACSGGVFQNTMLIDMLKKMAKNEHTLYFNCNLSPNDEAISFGQIQYYLHIKHS